MGRGKDKLSKHLKAHPVMVMKGNFKFIFTGILGLLFLAGLFPGCSNEKSEKAVYHPCDLYLLGGSPG